MIIPFDEKAMKELDVEPWVSIVGSSFGEDIQFRAKEGYNYRTLIWLVQQYTGSVFLDLGTMRGASALALASNRSNFVKSWDVSCRPRKRAGYAWPRIDGYDNIEFIEGDAYIDSLEYARLADVIYLDLAHDGVSELDYYRCLGIAEFRGLLIMDDINYKAFPRLHEVWVNEIERPKRELLWAHYSGVGVVAFV